MKILSDLSALFFPRICPVCGEAMGEGEELMCTRCRFEIPLTGYSGQTDNPVAEKFWGHLPLAQAGSFFFYSEKSDFRNLVHAFKYRGGWRLASGMGEWYGSALKEGGLYGDVDTIIPVPLHYLRLMRRGYNQSEYIARGISRALGIPVDTRSVRRKVNNPSQTLSQADERWENVQGIFTVRRPEALQGRHILLVDDVLTTGATIISCAGAILAAAPDARISIATLAVSKKGLRIP